jgi:hypothetical protein
MRRLAAMLLALAAGPAAAADRPPLMPTRDVDVVYMMIQSDARGAPRVVEERMRWAAGAGLLRIDPPTPGLWIVVNTRTRRMSTVRESDHSVLDIESAQAMPAPPPNADFLRHGTDTVADVPCTEWRTTDMTGEATLACITEDGVLLRAIAAGGVLLEALHLSYAAQNLSVFEIPQDYRRIQPPPLKRAPP